MSYLIFKKNTDAETACEKIWKNMTKGKEQNPNDVTSGYASSIELEDGSFAIPTPVLDYMEGVTFDEISENIVVKQNEDFDLINENNL